MVEDCYHDRRLVELYDLLNGWAADDDFYLSLMGPAAARVLDLGCGTGRLAIAMAAAGHDVTGVDPSEPMLAVARAQPAGSAVTWSTGDARTLRLGRRFDRIVSSGHAFQVFLSDADQLAFLGTIATHLAASGIFAFETRNPTAREWSSWASEASRQVVKHPAHGEVEVSYDVAEPGPDGVLAYTTIYRFRDQGSELRCVSRLRFTSRDDLLARVDQAGLKLLHLHGDWDHSPWRERSREIIVVGR